MSAEVTLDAALLNLAQCRSARYAAWGGASPKCILLVVRGAIATVIRMGSIKVPITQTILKAKH